MYKKNIRQESLTTDFSSGFDSIHSLNRAE